MKWKITWPLNIQTLVEADTLDIEDGCLVFGRGKCVKDHVVVLAVNDDRWLSVEEYVEPHERKETP